LGEGVLEFRLRGKTHRPFQQEIHFAVNVVEIAVDFPSRDLTSHKSFKDVIDYWGGPKLDLEAR
jgi:hypothetical protein